VIFSYYWLLILLRDQMMKHHMVEKVSPMNVNI